jgi:pimeloyl-ACP methyl ester carboxylesterase
MRHAVDGQARSEETVTDEAPSLDEAEGLSTRAANKPRPQLVLLPGLLCDADLWRDQIGGLSDLADCHVADLTRGETLSELAQTVLAEAAPSFALAGFSLGGYVAQEIARQAPDRIERLAFIDTSIRPDSLERAAARRSLIAAARLPGQFKGITDRMLPTYVHPSRLSDRDLIGRIRAMNERLGRDVFIRQNALDRPDGEAALRSLDCPVLIICGEQDALTPLSDHQDMAAMIPQAHLVIVKESGHMTPMERPRAVTEALRQWLVASA